MFWQISKALILGLRPPGFLKLCSLKPAPRALVVGSQTHHNQLRNKSFCLQGSCSSECSPDQKTDCFLPWFPQDGVGENSCSQSCKPRGIQAFTEAEDAKVKPGSFRCVGREQRGSRSTLALGHQPKVLWSTHFVHTLS